MLSIGKLAGNKADYYLKKIAQGIEDYYTGAGEAPGWWTGSATDEIEVFGQVEGELLHRALAGQHPKTGGQLARPPHGAIRVPGYDLTFSAPKSASLLFALADPQVSREVREAHDVAVQAALSYMERQGAVGRRGRGGVVAVEGNGFLAAAFRHRTSRAGDPQLHTHVLVANMTRGPDGRWTALDAKRLYAHAKTGGYLYQAQLRAELTRRLGVQWTQVRNGQAEIAGFASPVLRAFSQRRAEVKARMDERGEQSARAAQTAALDTRRAKDYAVDSERLVDTWRRRAVQLGLDLAELVDLLHRSEPHPLDEQQAQSVQDQLAGPDGLTRQRSSFTRRDVIQAWCERLPEGADVALVEELGDEFLRSERAVPLLSDENGLAGTDVIRRGDGRIVPVAPEGRPYSTPELLEIERETIQRALDGQYAQVGIVDRAVLEEAIGRRPTLSAEQTVMVQRLCLDGATVQVVVGKAGTGKTFGMDAAREAWEAQGYRVYGAALARRAAYELRDSAGIESTSITGLLADLREGGPSGLLGQVRTVLVIDEAGMVGTRQLAEILEHCERARAKIVLLGDHHQLPEIHAGGLFRGLVVRMHPVVLTENRRQQEMWEREALDLLRAGKAEQALSRYQHNDRVVIERSAEEARRRMVADWWEARERGRDVAMIALRRDDVRDLNGRARATMAAAGRLGNQSIELASREFAAGDQIVTLRNSRRLGVLNGTRATITAVDPVEREIEMLTSDGHQITLPPDYLEPSEPASELRLDHGYAITGHKAQGMTTETVLVLGTEALYREWGYTALSRGQRENRIYLTGPGPAEREEFAPSTNEKRDPLQAAITALQRSRAELLATDTLQAHELSQAPTRELLADFDQLHAELSQSTRRSNRRGVEIRRQRETAERAAAASQARFQDTEQHASDPSKLASERAALHQAQERIAALSEQEREAPSGASATPVSSQTTQRYLAVRQELIRRREGYGHVLAVDPPGYLTAALGPVPDRISARKRWQRTAVDIESYRERFAVDDPEHALGTQPGDLRQRSAWRELRQQIDRTSRSLDTPERELGHAIER